MSLATRCTACGTVFRIVQDQLKVSEGWVRCGRCSEVFNALPSLFDLERDAPSRLPSDVSDHDASLSAPDTNAFSAAHASPADHPVDPPGMPAQDAGQQSTPAARTSEPDSPEFPDAQFDPDMLADETSQRQMPLAELESAAVARQSLDTSTAQAPAFLVHADRRARLQSPASRALQAVLALLLIFGLTLQGAHHFRNLIAARWPETAPMLSAWCRAVACNVEAPGRIEDVVVESTELTRAAAPETFKLAAVLRNRGATPVASPWIDLALTDNAGQLIARRMLSPADLRLPSTVMMPASESTVQLTLGTGNASVTGYTIEVFYP